VPIYHGSGGYATDAFEDVGHSTDAQEMMGKYAIGKLVTVSRVIVFILYDLLTNLNKAVVLLSLSYTSILQLNKILLKPGMLGVETKI